MCLTIVNRKGEYYNKKPRPFVAKKPIKVYKVLDGMYSPYRRFRWQRGYNYYEDQPLIVGVDYRLFIIGKGLHAYQSRDDAHGSFAYSSTSRIVEMIIPKGAKYFLGDNGDIVSDKLNFPAKKKS